MLNGAHQIFLSRKDAVVFQARYYEPEHFDRSVREKTFSQRLAREASRQWFALMMFIYCFDREPRQSIN
jgi:hypothetical protein